MERTRVALAEYAATIRRTGAARLRMVATSATRDARNRDEFADMVVETLGVPPEVVSGDEEAALSFAGANRGMPAAVAEPPYLVVDIGGGSTEFVLGTQQVVAARSVDIGCVRLTERHLHDDPPVPAQVEALVADIDAGLALVREVVPLERARTLIGLAGSVTTVAGIALGLDRYDATRIHHARIPAHQVRQVVDALLRETAAERAAHPVMHPGRVDVIAAGALVLATVLDRLGLPDVVASEHDILDGIAWSAAAEGG